MKNLKLKYETPDAKKIEYADDDIMEISVQNDDGDNGWGEFVPIIKKKLTVDNDDWTENVN